jgi:hypothetical protein
VVKKHDFCSTQQKILQKSDFANNRDMNRFPHGETAAGLAKMFARIFLQKSIFRNKKLTFFAKIGFRNKKSTFFAKIDFRNKKSTFFAKIEFR